MLPRPDQGLQAQRPGDGTTAGQVALLIGRSNLVLPLKHVAGQNTMVVVLV